jgi:hypoxanthine phosphoribosyltransferase
MRQRSKSLPKKTSSIGLTVPLHSQLKIVHSEKQIQKRIRALADQINRDYKGRTLHVVGILEDSFLFMADLVRALKVPVICHFVKSEIHDSSKLPLREIMFTPKVESTGRDILLIDGILQSGVTLDYLVGYLMAQGPSSIRTATLIEKARERKVDIATDYVGFKGNGKYLVGYGLGYQEKYRNLPYLARLT